MRRRHGISRQTSRRLILDAGVLVFNYGLPNERKLGATRGGSTWSLKRALRTIEVDGARGPVKGMRRIESVEAQIQVNVLEITKENILSFISGSRVDENLNPTHDVITGREILPTDYIDNIALIATLSGNPLPVILILKNALAEGDWSMQLQDKNEANPQITFTAHYDPENMSEEPWEIHYPRESEPMPYSVRINGSDSVEIPTEGINSVTIESSVLDQFGDPWPDEGSILHEVFPHVEGVVIDPDNPQLIKVYPEATVKQFTIRASHESEHGTIYGYKTVKLIDTRPTPTTVEIQGESTITLPVKGQTSTRSYTAVVYDQYGAAMPEHTVTWSVAGAGASIEQNGELTITDVANEGIIVVSASVQ